MVGGRPTLGALGTVNPVDLAQFGYPASIGVGGIASELLCKFKESASRLLISNLMDYDHRQHTSSARVFLDGDLAEHLVQRVRIRRERHRLHASDEIRVADQPSRRSRHTTENTSNLLFRLVPQMQRDAMMRMHSTTPLDQIRHGARLVWERSPRWKSNRATKSSRASGRRDGRVPHVEPAAFPRGCAAMCYLPRPSRKRRPSVPPAQHSIRTRPLAGEPTLAPRSSAAAHRWPIPRSPSFGCRSSLADPPIPVVRLPLRTAHSLAITPRRRPSI